CVCLSVVIGLWVWLRVPFSSPSRFGGDDVSAAMMRRITTGEPPYGRLHVFGICYERHNATLRASASWGRNGEATVVSLALSSHGEMLCKQLCQRSARGRVLQPAAPVDRIAASGCCASWRRIAGAL